MRAGAGASIPNATSSRTLDKSFPELSTQELADRIPERFLPSSQVMASMSGDELHELSERQDPRLLRALDVVAPGGSLREGIDNIVHSRTGGLIVVGDPGDISH